MYYLTHSSEETQEIAKKLAEKYHSGGVIALFGDLGAGKTTFTQGFAKGLQIKEKVVSPTFIIKREYPLPNNKEGKFYHLDLYRLDDPSQLEGIGIFELFTNPANVVLIEWAEKLGNLLPKTAVKIKFNFLSEDSRKIEVQT